jgi:poly-gamma-glutamate capsule biosynthesis protein CapA/YwtB (metallophosphatase superfamily)
MDSSLRGRRRDAPYPGAPRPGGHGARRLRRALATLIALLVAALVASPLVGCSGAFDLGQTGGDAQAAATMSARGPSGASGRQASDRPAEPDEAATLDMVCVGDVIGHMPLVDSGLAPDGTRSYDHLFAQVRPDIEAADVAVVNQETPLGGEGLGLSGYPLFNSPQELGDAEVAAGFDVVTCATNHAVDKGAQGIANELAFWRTRHPETKVLGIADSQASYDQICVVEKDGLKVALLNYAYGLNGLSMPADNPYAVHLLDEGQVAADLARARQMADMVVIFPHWGDEYATAPNDNQRRWARFFCDNGADVIVGTHTHSLQPVETIEGDGDRHALVFWSLGNFASNQPTALKATGGMARFRLVKDDSGCYVGSWELDPVVCQTGQGASFAVYELAAYTDELAAANGAGVGSVAACQDVCSAALGPGYDRERSVLAGGEVRTAA